MTDSLSSIQGYLPPLAFPSVSPADAPLAQKASGASFQQLLMNAIGSTNAMEQSAQRAIETSLQGGEITQIEVLTAVKKADMALDLMIQVRNKMLEAFNEMKQMQL